MRADPICAPLGLIPSGFRPSRSGRSVCREPSWKWIDGWVIGSSGTPAMQEATVDLICGCVGLAGHLSHLLRRLSRDVDPAWVALARDLDAHERVEGMLVDAVVAVAHDGAVDIS